VIRPAEEGKLEVSYRWFRTCKDAGEIKRMYIRPKFRGEKLGNLLIEEVIDVSVLVVFGYVPRFILSKFTYPFYSRTESISSLSINKPILPFPFISSSIS